MHNQLGQYKIGKTAFANKTLALLDATAQRKAGNPYVEVQWDYFDDTFNRYNLHRRKLGLDWGVSDLPRLHLARAKQLRDQYDYLALQYSGGSDSWTILNTFIKYNIPIDEIVVRHAVCVADKFAVGPAESKVESNYLHEWTKLLKADLEALAQSLPFKCKITVYDFLKDRPRDYVTDEDFIQHSHWVEESTILNAQPIQLGAQEADRVAMIWGLDKPIVQRFGSKYYLCFSDSALHVAKAAVYAGRADVVAEPFYWTPMMPELAFAEAMCVMKAVDAGSEHIVRFDSNWQKRDRVIRGTQLQDYNDFCVGVIRPDYPKDRFQVRKSTRAGNFKHSKCPWLYTLPEMQRYCESWDHVAKSYLSQIDDKWFFIDGMGKSGFRTFFTRFHYLGDSK